MKSNLIKPSPLKKGDNVAIVSLSSGLLGEDFCKHDIPIGKKRLEDMDLLLYAIWRSYQTTCYHIRNKSF
jgi:muramoyltetrapeptide carboxypeptidase LdcA involved in peptidoglycan recycling